MCAIALQVQGSARYCLFLIQLAGSCLGFILQICRGKSPVGSSPGASILTSLCSESASRSKRKCVTLQGSDFPLSFLPTHSIARSDVPQVGRRLCAATDMNMLSVRADGYQRACSIEGPTCDFFSLLPDKSSSPEEPHSSVCNRMCAVGFSSKPGAV